MYKVKNYEVVDVGKAETLFLNENKIVALVWFEEIYKLSIIGMGEVKQYAFIRVRGDQWFNKSSCNVYKLIEDAKKRSEVRVFHSRKEYAEWLVRQHNQGGKK